MAGGSLLMAGGLVLLALVRSPPAYLLAWAFLGLAMRMCLYDAAFAALVQVTPSRGRRAISYLMFSALPCCLASPTGLVTIMRGAVPLALFGACWEWS
jgi:hypothetical protein